MKNIIVERFKEHQALVELMLNNGELQDQIQEIVDLVVQRLEMKSRLLICGNGGSAADAQHLAAEFSGRFYLDRKPLDAEALHVNSSYITAVGNDYSFENIYERAVQAKGREGDVLIALSTSGESENIIRACIAATAEKMIVIGFTGEKPCRLDEHTDLTIKIPSSNTPRIQEGHMLVGHTICEMVEKKIFA